MRQFEETVQTFNNVSASGWLRGAAAVVIACLCCKAIINDAEQHPERINTWYAILGLLAIIAIIALIAG